MKAQKQSAPNYTDKEYPLLPWDRQKAIMEFFMYRLAKPFEDSLREMSGAEKRFYFALMDLIDAYGQAPDARYRDILNVRPISG
jgi:hypothetical protein